MEMEIELTTQNPGLYVVFISKTSQFSRSLILDEMNNCGQLNVSREEDVSSKCVMKCLNNAD